MRARTCLLTCLGLGTFAGGPIPMRVEGAEQGPRAVFGAEISIVALPVFVVDRRGRALRGLGPEDFELYEDGKRVEVVSFQYVDTTSAEDQVELKQVPAARRHFLLLFDLSFTDPAGLHRAREAAKDLVRRRLADSDLVAVATFDVNRGVRVIANFTEDRALLSHAVDTLGVTNLARINDPLSLSADILTTDVQQGAAAGRFGETSGVVADQVAAVILRLMRAADENLYRSQVTALIGSLDELATGLRTVEGRKQVLYFSAGFDSRALVGLGASDQRSASMAITEGRLQDVDHATRYGDARVRQLLGDALKNLSNSDSVVHTVDVTGLGSDGSLTRNVVMDDLSRPTSGREALHLMASDTGGRFYKDANDLSAAMGEILDMTSRYYILGYTPLAQKGPGAFHKVKVKVRRQGAKTSHRAGYYERVPRPLQTALQRKFEAAQLVMTGVGRNDLGFSALCLPFPSAGDRQTLGVVVQVPKDALRWEPGHPVAIEFFAYAVAEDGTVVDHLAHLARVNPPDQGPTQGVSLHGTLRVPPGRHTIKLMVQEPESGAAGVQFIDVTVPPHDARVGFLLPPVVMEEPGRWMVMDLGLTSMDRPPSPFRAGGTVFLPRTSFQVKSGTPEKLVVMAYEPERPFDPAASLDIQSALTRADGTPVAPGPIRLLRLHREGDGRRTYVLAYTPEGLSRGDYTLRIGVGEAGTRLESYSLLRVTAADAADVR